MTQKLYDANAYAKTFLAQVVSCTPTPDGYDTVLDATLFFPEEGGQSGDTGRLNGVAVTDVRLQDDGTIVHRTQEPLCGTVEGELDWPARFRKMQHHTGEHILSGLFDRLYGYANVGFHLGETEVTLDVGGPLIEEQIRSVERRANEVIWQDCAVTAAYPDAETLAKTPYRAKRAHYEHTRLVTIEGVDCCACCAPHVSSTGQIGCLKIVRFARQKDATRLWIVCGGDALALFHTLWQQNSRVSKQLKVPVEATADGVEKLCEQLKELTYQNGALRRALLQQKAEQIPKAPGSLCLVLADGDNEQMLYLLNLIRQKTDAAAAVLWGNDDAGYRFLLADQEENQAKNTALIAALHGNGGGRNGFFQGKMQTDRVALQAAFTRVIFL